MSVPRFADPRRGGRLYLGIDVGTGSARAGIFDDAGKMHGMGVHPIQTWRPEEDFVEQSSDDIWTACGAAVRVALAQAGVSGDKVRGIGFDATCSLVALDAEDKPVTVSKSGSDAQNVIVWMDHRATAQAERINATRHEVLGYVGGIISPEMETPKLLWLKEKLAASYARTTRFFDLPDFLAYRATGADVRSLCTTVCKWTYRGDEQRWDDGFFQLIGLADLIENDHAKIGARVRPMGEKMGTLTETAARELGLSPGIPVGVAIIDAHAGGVGMIGVTLDGMPPTEESIEERLALICGTSSCHMAASRAPKRIAGIWGPYYSAMIPGMWLTEGGQSATGALIDHVIHSHAKGAELSSEARAAGTTVYALLNTRLDRLAQGSAFPAELTRGIHVLPDHHGNRSPRADATLRGMVSGLRLTDSVDSLALLYLATVQAIALGTRHIVHEMNAAGYRIRTLIACGGDAKNPLFVREHADATGCRIVLPREQEAVLLGSAILGAVACGDEPTVIAAMGKMTSAGPIVSPTGGAVAVYHDAKYGVFRRMYDDQMEYRRLMQ